VFPVFACVLMFAAISVAVRHVRGGVAVWFGVGVLTHGWRFGFAVGAVGDLDGAEGGKESGGDSSRLKRRGGRRAGRAREGRGGKGSGRMGKKAKSRESRRGGAKGVREELASCRARCGIIIGGAGFANLGKLLARRLAGGL
jgi:hypothetical protein